MFDIDQFIADCCAAVREDRTHRAAREIIARAVSDPTELIAALGEPKQAGVERLHHAPDLTILNVVWGPSMNVPPHNHDMWAVIGVYGGREDNIFWRQIDDENGRTIEAAGAKTLAPKTAEPLGRDIIHSVTNPIDGLTAAIHVYGGDFFGADRLEWDPENHRPTTYNIDRTMRRFEQSNLLLNQ